MAKYLKKLGHEPIVICANTLHNGSDPVIDTNENWHMETAEEIRVPFVFLKCRPYKGNGKDRVLNIIDFYRGIKKCYKDISREYGKPDIVLGSSIHPLAPVAAVKISKKLSAKCICEYRDLWPDELISMGAMGENSMPARILRRIEYWSYKRADALIFTMEGAAEYIKSRKWDKKSGGAVDLDKAIYINNGVDLEEYNNNIEKYKINDDDLDNDDTFKVIYTGMIRRANGIDKILEIAKKLKDHPQIKFLLYGSGNETDDIIKQIKDERISNVIYKGSVNKQYIPYVLSKSDLNLLNYMNGDLFRYGCSNNKLFEYLASGKPILCTIKMNYSILRKYNCGIEVDENCSIDEMADLIRNIYLDPGQASEYRKNTLTAVKNFDFAYLSQILDKVMNGVVRK